MGRAGWEQVTTGRSGAEVRRSRDGSAYTKSGGGHLRQDLLDERDRLAWLATTDLSAPEVLDWADDGEAATLTLRALPGVPMSELPASNTAAAARALGRFLRRLHALPRESCPFERWLSVTVPLARVRVESGLVDETDFDPARAGRTSQALLAELLELRPHAEGLEVEELVVCHGDACLPNFLVDPDAPPDRMEVTGMLDVHRLGVADRHLDLALATRSMSDTSLNPAYGPDVTATLLETYGRHTDQARIEFYRLLDEFF